MVRAFCATGAAQHGPADYFDFGLHDHPSLGAIRALVPLQRQLVVGYQYGDHDHQFLHGARDSEHQNRASLHIKIYELIRVTQTELNTLLDLEEVDDKTLEALRADCGRLVRKAKSRTKVPARAEAVPEKRGRSRSRKR